MQKNIFIGIVLLFILACFVLTLLIPKQLRVDKKTMNVVCTTSIIANVVKHVGGDRVCVHGLMGPGIDPHLYRARESDVHKLASADIIFYNGLHLEGKMADMLKKMQLWVCTVAVGDAVEKDVLIASEFDGMYDPHVWHDVSLWMKVVEKIRDSLSERDSEHTHEYEERAQNYLQELAVVHAYVKEQASQIPKEQRILVTAHDAFSYFGRAYGFEVIGLQGISTDAEVGTKDIQNLVSYIVEHRVPALFLESSIPQRNIQAVQQAAQARGWHVAVGSELFSDALGDPDKLEGTYSGMIRHNIDTIVFALTRNYEQQ